MKYQTFSDDLKEPSLFFHMSKDALLKAVNRPEDPKHPVLRVKYKITFYWK